MEYESDDPLHATLPGEHPTPVWNQRRGPIAPREYVIPPGPTPHVSQRGLLSTLRRTSPRRTPWGYISASMLFFALAFLTWAPILGALGTAAATAGWHHEQKKPRYRRSPLPVLAGIAHLVLVALVTIGNIR